MSFYFKTEGNFTESAKQEQVFAKMFAIVFDMHYTRGIPIKR